MKAKILTPVVTIFNEDNSIDYDGNEIVIEYLIENGVDGIVPLGSTGEFPDMSYEDRKEFLEFYLSKVDKRVEIIAGTSSLNYEETVNLSNYAIELGAKGVLVIPPYYFGMSQDEGYRYYNKLAKDVKGNIYIYNFEARSGFDMSKETLVKLLKENKNIVGMKDSTASFAHTKECIMAAKEVNEDFEMYSGFDDHFISNVICGGAGCIAALSNIVPSMWSEWVEATNKKDVDKVIEISDKINILMDLYGYKSNFAILFKKLMKEQGVNINEHSLFPFDQIDKEDYESAKYALKKIL